MCEECTEKGGYRAENYKAFDNLCAKAFYEFCIRLEDVPEKLTDKHVRQNEATVNIKEATKDVIDAWLEEWVRDEFAGYFTEDPSFSNTQRREPNSLYGKFKRYMESKEAKEVIGMNQFTNRLGRKFKNKELKRTQVAKQEGSKERIPMYLIDVPALVAKLDMEGTKATEKSKYDQRTSRRP